MFLLLLCQTEEFKDRHTVLLNEELEIQLKREKIINQKAARSELEKFSSTISKHYESVALLLLKGCFVSNTSYNKIRSLLSFNLNQETGIVMRSKLPKIALVSLPFVNVI